MLHWPRAPLAIAAALSSLALSIASADASSPSLDTSFGDGGQKTVRLNGGWFALAGDAVALPGGGFVVVGTEYDYGVAVAKFTADGQLDPSFDGDGITTYPLPTPEALEAGGVAVDSTGAVYVAVDDYYAANAKVVKFTAAGTLDPAFGIRAAGADTRIGGIALDEVTGRVLVGAAHQDEFRVLALHMGDGQPDLTYSDDGIGAVGDAAAAGPLLVNDLVRRPTDGAVYLAGSEQVDFGGGEIRNRPVVARLTSAGARDMGFGVQGLVRPFTGSDERGELRQLLIDGDKVYAAGGVRQDALQRDNALAIARLTDSGDPDPSFDGDGRVTDVEAETNSHWDGLALQNDGKLVATGGRFGASGARAVTRRYGADGAPDTGYADGGLFTVTENFPAVALIDQSAAKGRHVSVSFEDDPDDPTESLLVLTGITSGALGSGGTTTTTTTPAPSGGGGTTPPAGGGGGERAVLHEYTMPNVLPARAGGKVAFRSAATVKAALEAELRRLGLNVPVVLNPRGISSMGDFNGLTGAQITGAIKEGDIYSTKPAPGKLIPSSASAVTLSYYEPDLDPKPITAAPKKGVCQLSTRDEVDRVRLLQAEQPRDEDDVEKAVKAFGCAYGLAAKTRVASQPSPVVIVAARRTKGTPDKISVEVNLRSAVKPPDCPLRTMDEVDRIRYFEAALPEDDVSLDRLMRANGCRYELILKAVKTLTRPFVVTGAKKVTRKVNGESEESFDITASTVDLVPPPTSVPPRGTPPASRNAYCQTSVRFAQVTATGSCLKRVGLTWESTSPVKLLGVTFSGTVVLDPLNLRIAGTGTVATPDAVLQQGRFEWSWQSGLPASVAQPLGAGVKLPPFTALPGMGGLRLPQLSGSGLPDFGAVGQTTLRQLGIADLDSVAAVIPPPFVPNVALPLIRVPGSSGARTRAEVSAFGLNLAGSSVGQANGQTQHSYDLTLPQSLGGLTVGATFAVDANGNRISNVFMLSVPPTEVFGLKLKQLDMAYDPGRGDFSGLLDLTLPFPGEPGLKGVMDIRGGELDNIYAETTGGPFDLGFARFKGTALSYSREGGGGVALNGFQAQLGPPLPTGDRLIDVDGYALYEPHDILDNQAHVVVKADAYLPGRIKLGDGRVEFFQSRGLYFKGGLDLSIASVNVNATVEGQVPWNGDWFVLGNGGFSMPGLSGELSAIVSRLGVAACATGQIGPFRGSLGVGRRWDGNVDILGNTCDFGPYLPNRIARAAQAGTATVKLPAGLPSAAIRVTGTSAPPELTIKAPGGETLSTGDQVAASAKFLIIEDPASRTTNISIASPAAGAYEITAAAGSTILKTESAQGLPDPGVKGVVTGSGKVRTLKWTANRVSGQKLTFIDKGPTTQRQIGTSTATKGVLRFTPVEDRTGVHQVIALVEQNGRARERVVVAKLRAVSAPLPKRPRVKLRRAGTTLTAAWTGSLNATGYEVKVIHSGKVTSVATLGAAARTFRVKNALPTAQAQVSVTPLASRNRRGRPGRAVAKAVSGPIGGGKARRRARGG